MILVYLRRLSPALGRVDGSERGGEQRPERERRADGRALQLARVARVQLLQLGGLEAAREQPRRPAARAHRLHRVVHELTARAPPPARLTYRHHASVTI